MEKVFQVPVAVLREDCANGSKGCIRCVGEGAVRMAERESWVVLETIPVLSDSELHATNRIIGGLQPLYTRFETVKARFEREIDAVCR